MNSRQMKPLPKRWLEHFCCCPVKRSDRAASHPGSASQQRRAIRSLLFPQKLARFGGHLFAYAVGRHASGVFPSKEQSDEIVLRGSAARLAVYSRSRERVYAAVCDNDGSKKMLIDRGEPTTQ